MAKLCEALLDFSSARKTLPAYVQAPLTTTVENAVPAEYSAGGGAGDFETDCTGPKVRRSSHAVHFCKTT
jgi:hypothetical protein